MPKSPLGALLEAEKQARAVLHEAAIETRWIDCPLAGLRVDPGPCDAPTDFFVTILARIMTEFPASEQDALGFALPCHRLGAGCMAYMFYARIEAIAADGDATPSVILGHAMAHEIGHLLLGPGAGAWPLTAGDYASRMEPGRPGTRLPAPVGFCAGASEIPASCSFGG